MLPLLFSVFSTFFAVCASEEMSSSPLNLYSEREVDDDRNETLTDKAGTVENLLDEDEHGFEHSAAAVAETVTQERTGQTIKAEGRTILRETGRQRGNKRRHRKR